MLFVSSNKHMERVSVYYIKFRFSIDITVGMTNAISLSHGTCKDMGPETLVCLKQ